MKSAKRVTLVWVLALLAAFLVIAGNAGAADSDTAYRELEAMFIAPDFCGKTLAECPALVSENMRQEIRVMLQAGKSKEEIVDKFVNQYGYQILAAPPKQGFFLAAWVLPIVALVVGVWVMYAFLQRARRDRREATPRSANTKDDQPLDMELQDRIREEVLRRL